MEMSNYIIDIMDPKDEKSLIVLKKNNLKIMFMYFRYYFCVN